MDTTSALDFDPYDVLGVPRTASIAEIRAAYRAAAKTAHPDAGGTPEGFARLNAAHDLLTDPDARAFYDQTGKAATSAAKPHPDAIPFQMIRNLLGHLLKHEEEPFDKDAVAVLVSAIDTDLAGFQKEIESMARI